MKKYLLIVIMMQFSIINAHTKPSWGQLILHPIDAWNGYRLQQKGESIKAHAQRTLKGLCNLDFKKCSLELETICQDLEILKTECAKNRFTKEYISDIDLIEKAIKAAYKTAKKISSTQVSNLLTRIGSLFND